LSEENLSNIIVIKRSGKKVNFDGMKIAVAIKKGFDSIEGKYNEDDANKIYNNVIQKIETSNIEKLKIEEIQDLIEEELHLSGYEDVYNSFAQYREKRNQSREIFFEEKRKHKFLKALEKLGLNSKGEIIQDDKNSLETMIAYGKAVSEEFATSYLMKKKIADSHENGDIHINKIDSYPIGTTESTQMDIEKLFTDGFDTRKCSMREPQSISSYSMLTIVAISSNQKDQSGEQAIPNFDFYMAPGVIKTFKKEFRQTIYDILEYTDYDKFIAINGIDREINKLSTIDFDIEQFYKFTREAEELKRMFRIVYKKALDKTNKQVYQAMEALSHDLNSIGENQITTINLGTDTSAEGRMITKNLLTTIEEGLGENKKAGSPIIVFKVKKGINFEEKDPNYDLYKKACEIAVDNSNICFSFQDSQFNSQFYKEGDYNTEVAYFENGSRVIDNFVDNDKQIAAGRGIISSTVLNLPRIALKNQGNIDSFFEDLDSKLELIKEQMIERLDIQSNKSVENFPFLMKQNVWIDSEKLKEGDKVRRILKQGSLQVLFTGLNECIVALTGKDLTNDSQKLGLKIVTKMREKLNEFSNKYNLNFVLGGNEDKEIDKDFLEFDRIIFGKIPNITDKERYTPSFELEKCNDIKKKIKYEAPFHELTNGGHNFKLNAKEINGEDLQKILKEIEKNEIGFVSIK